MIDHVVIWRKRDKEPELRLIVSTTRNGYRWLTVEELATDTMGAESWRPVQQSSVRAEVFQQVLLEVLPR